MMNKKETAKKDSAHSGPSSPVQENDLSGFKKIMLGALELFILTDGYLHEENVDSFAPRSQVSELKKILKEHFRPEDYIEMALNILLVKTKDRLILLDAGMGIFADERAGFLLKSLNKAGFSVKDITDVFISHAHPDHIGGLVDEKGNLVFSNAGYFISETEYDFWMNATLDDFGNSALKDQPELISQMISPVQNILKTIRPRLTFFDLNQELYGHFSFQAAPGHTPGLTMTTISSGKEKLICIADIVHSDVVVFPHPDWGYFGDADLDIAIQTRISVLRHSSETEMRVFAFHMPWPGLGFTGKAGQGFKWIPEGFMHP
ncbi:MBL fold metallo-hydrolase [uncultured Chryseobacterium sp.]|uniref:MBL fold metallo-hydrolase n=1 Tax=uncultured Chryseobacterium sp. TaxID=259322 RepID=UPI0025D34C8B|nr:MBL fold metallo-hydrolase [uncultured Chryseobacterium sp.]